MKKRAKSKTVVRELKAAQPMSARQKREIQILIANARRKDGHFGNSRTPSGSMEESGSRQVVSPCEASGQFCLIHEDSLVRRRLLGVIDDNNIDGSFGR